MASNGYARRLDAHHVRRPGIDELAYRKQAWFLKVYQLDVNWTSATSLAYLRWGTFHGDEPRSGGGCCRSAGFS